MAAFLSTYSAASLRHAVVTWAFHNKPLWEGKCAVAADEWLRLMRQDKHWGDHVSLFCAAQLLARPLVIFKDLPGVPPLLVAPVDVPWGAPLFLLLDDVDPGAEHFSPLFPISRKRLRSKQPDLLGHLVDGEVHIPTTSSSRRRNALQERPPDGARLCRRRFDATLRKPASKPAPRPPSTNMKALAPVARGLADRGVSQTAIQGLLNVAKDSARKLLHTACTPLTGLSLDKALQERRSALEFAFLEKFFHEACEAWMQHAHAFGIVTAPLPQPQLPVCPSADWVWMTLASWLLCISCGLRISRMQWTHSWMTTPFLHECDFCKSLTKTPLLRSLVPRKAFWPEELVALSPVEWQELALLDFKVDYRTCKGGRSPVVSRQKLSVTRGVWRKDLPRPTSPRLESALAWLLANNKHYEFYYSKLRTLLAAEDISRTVPTAQLLLRMPGVEVAARPWLYPQAAACRQHHPTQTEQNKKKVPGFALHASDSLAVSFLSFALPPCATSVCFLHAPDRLTWRIRPWTA